MTDSTSFRRPLKPSRDGSTASKERGQHCSSSGNTTSLDEYNNIIRNREFYGTSGILSFLTKLRDQAYEADENNVFSTYPSADRPASPTVVDFLHDGSEKTGSQSLNGTSNFESSNLLKQELIRLFFENLHLIHPVLDRDIFLQTCQKLIWSRKGDTENRSSMRPHHPFFAIYNAVLALGAVVAPDDQESISRFEEMAKVERSDGYYTMKIVSPFQLAETYFERAKAYLGDVFTIRSIAGTITLLLFSIYSQNTLRSHACYLYSGMAVRTALAIGPGSYTDSNDTQLMSRLWWTVYSHEVEMCASAGRMSALADVSSYNIPLPSIPGSTEPAWIINHSVSLAAITNEISKEIYQSTASNDIDDRDKRSHRCAEIDNKLHDWQARVDFETTPRNAFMTEAQYKQKIVLDLRSLNARILLHKPFLQGSATIESQLDHQAYDHLGSCLEASRSTVNLLYEAYTTRPYFRTWWYNTTYLMYATLSILYVLFIGHSLDSALSDDIQKSLTTLNSMKSNIVASRCASVVKEVYDILKTKKKAMLPSNGGPGMTSQPPNDNYNASLDAAASEDSLLSGLIETNFFDEFLNFEMTF